MLNSLPAILPFAWKHWCVNQQSFRQVRMAKDHSKQWLALTGSENLDKPGRTLLIAPLAELCNHSCSPSSGRGHINAQLHQDPGELLLLSSCPGPSLHIIGCCWVAWHV